MPWGVQGTLVFWAYCSVGVPSCPALPRRPAVRPDPTRPWYVRVLESTGLNRNSFVRASKDTPREVFLHCLEGKRGGYQSDLFRVIPQGFQKGGFKPEGFPREVLTRFKKGGLKVV